MKLLLELEEVREAIREYAKSKGFTLAVPKTLNQNTGMTFIWDSASPMNKLRVELKIKED